MEQIGKVLEMIVCPACRGRLELHAALKDDGAKSGLSIVRCTACGNSYPLEDGIPILLVARANKPA